MLKTSGESAEIYEDIVQLKYRYIHFVLLNKSTDTTG